MEAIATLRPAKGIAARIFAPMPLTPNDLTDALRTVLDPDIRKDLVTLGMVKENRVEGDRAKITIELTTPACPMKDKIRSDVEAAVAAKAAERGRASPGSTSTSRLM